MTSSKKCPQKAIIFARVSSSTQRNEGYSLNTQVSRLQEYCRQKNLEIVKEFSVVESSKTMGQKEFFRMIDFIKKQKTKMILVCDSIDRMHRNFKEISYINELIKSNKLELICIKNDNFLYQLNALMSLRYSENLSKKVKIVFQSKLQNGEWIGKAPFGYKNITLENGKKDIVLDEIQASIVLEILVSFLTGEKLNDISKKFTLSRRVILNILKNPFYCGKMYIKKHDKFYPHKYEKLIPEEIFNKCQKILQSKERLIKKI
ncbi:recombinase family protein [Candidatus Deianiraea vastatrix]|uniref:Cassette chromosome recombinase B-like domain protein n=1 Tax=Candidatus Deianiraea vastatrix TaxID=2163644 RepID=A0A5B8XDC2_9RICK|nr:recombinase family protein [Candidatus Deianiraea vastatrix]QED23016.1 Putative cassette chromosome recombinase B-like domain protein [Candidatus Deianiraea vastatrix]